MVELTLENHLKLDARMDFLPLVDDKLERVPAEKYIELILSYELNVQVPEEVVGLYNRAKETMCYGIYHYPLFTAGADLLNLSNEAAMYYFTKSKGQNVKTPMLGNMIKFCEQNSLLSKTQLDRWDIVRHMRNMTFHQKQTSLYAPNMAINLLYSTKSLIEELFE